MCGRFVSATPPDQVAAYFGAEPPSEGATSGEWEANFNVAPTTGVYVVRDDGSVRRVEAMRWGLVPFWAKDPSIGSKMINARSETVAEKSAFRNAFRKKRCIVPADGFYEWKKLGGPKVSGRPAKQPMYVHRADGEPLAFAGLWEVWRDPTAPDTELHSCTILTTSANATMRPVHDRMPVILPPSAWDAWLDPAPADAETLGKLLVPAPDNLLELQPVSTDVNNVRNRGPHLLDPVDPSDPGDPSIAGQGTLL